MTLFELVLFGFGIQLQLFKKEPYDKHFTWFSFAIGSKEFGNKPFLRHVLFVVDFRSVNFGYLNEKVKVLSTCFGPWSWQKKFGITEIPSASEGDNENILSL